MPEIIPLKLLRPGSKAAIDTIDGQPDEVQRMEELGLQQGSEIEVLQHGCPCIVRCRGVKYCLRGNDCHCVWVRVNSYHDAGSN
ncbi:MAG: FeoA family protein [Pirellulaceae bacterium]|nr:FeoA family protein [Pirellulaceae bacterium]